MKDIKIGDRVRVYTLPLGDKGTVISIADPVLTVRPDQKSFSICAHIKQCRKLRPKKKKKKVTGSVWLNLYTDGHVSAHRNKEDASNVIRIGGFQTVEARYSYLVDE